MRWLLALGWVLPACEKEPEPISQEGCEDNEVCILAGTGELGFNGEDLPALETRLASPSAVYEGPDGHTIIVDYSNMLVRIIDDHGIALTMVGNGFHAYAELGAAPQESPLENPVDIGWNAQGNLCILPQHEGRVVCIEDNQVTAFAGTGEISDTGDGGPALEATMGYGSGMAFAEDGTLYVSDSTHSRIRRVNTDGSIETVLGTGEAGTGTLGFGPDTALRFPERLALDEEHGRLLVADTYNHRILAMDTDTLDVTLVAGTGDLGFSGDGGPALDAQFYLPLGVAIGPNGGVLISDTRNHVIRYVDAAGNIDTVMGTGETTVQSDPDLPLQFPVVGPAGLAWTQDGDLLVAEQFGHRILTVRNFWDAL